MDKIEIDSEKILNLQRAIYDVIIRDCGRVDSSIRKAMADNLDINSYNRLIQAAINVYIGNDGKVIRVPNPTGQMGLENGFVDGLKNMLKDNTNED